MSITPGAMRVIAGDSLSLTASVQSDVGVAASAAGIQWPTPDSTIAVVSSDGVVSAVDSGDAAITAHLLAGNTANAAVQVVKNSVVKIFRSGKA